MTNATITNTPVTEIIPAGTSFTPSSGVVMQVTLEMANAVAEINGTRFIQANRGGSLVVDDSITIDMNGNDGGYLSGYVVDS